MRHTHLSHQSISSSIKKVLLDILFPPVCIHCKNAIPRQELFLCDACRDDIQTFNALYCPSCNARRPTYDPCHPKEKYLIAPACRYEGPIVSLLHAFKYQRLAGIETFLSALAIAHLSSLGIPLQDYTVVPIPLASAREHQRGFNQSRLIATRIAHYFHIPYQEMLIRTKVTQSQAQQKDAAHRAMNVAGCFSLAENVSPVSTKIMLVDDVTTSGATLHEASMLLTAHGARHIIASVIARA